ncbi:alanyl-tRNA editing protein [Paenibacillus zeisoli]|uniref:Alanyl-tRNA editing protein n=1 Tax=Paenibacillus zeisoli TaxID=2496267 RepID=A0A433X6H7_9BACL|nr:DHHA1 domain-containing protein [Paenibacillus zeisoli]RUT29624.1 alanyl-tRNA editing protein [Paenibacillus zeisoli]
MTKKLYYDSAYTTEWQTGISQVLEREDGLYITLEETAYYPHGGGQPCDLGWINEIPVLDVILEGNAVLHKLERQPEGERVSCRVDWKRRFDHMKHHSGQHLLSAVCLNLLDALTVSFHLGDDYATIDIDKLDLTNEQLTAIECEANRLIYLNRSIDSYFVTNEEAAHLPLVKQPKVTENIRIVEIAGVEYNACGGTHVTSTGEIGIIKLLKSEKQKGNTRIYFKCGYRALEEFNASMQILASLSTKFNTGRDEILDRLEKWEHEHKQLQLELAAVKAENDSYFAQKLLSGAEGSLIMHVFENKPMKDMQTLAVKLSEGGGRYVLLASEQEHKVVLAQNGNQELSCGAYFKENLGTYHGKGGGSDKLAQAGFPSWDDAAAFIEFTRQSLS